MAKRYRIAIENLRTGSQRELIAIPAASLDAFTMTENTTWLRATLGPGDLVGEILTPMEPETSSPNATPAMQSYIKSAYENLSEYMGLI